MADEKDMYSTTSGFYRVPSPIDQGYGLYNETLDEMLERDGFFYDSDHEREYYSRLAVLAKDHPKADKVMKLLLKKASQKVPAKEESCARPIAINQQSHPEESSIIEKALCEATDRIDLSEMVAEKGPDSIPGPLLNESDFNFSSAREEGYNQIAHVEDLVADEEKDIGPIEEQHDAVIETLEEMLERLGIIDEGITDNEIESLGRPYFVANGRKNISPAYMLTKLKRSSLVCWSLCTYFLYEVHGKVFHPQDDDIIKTSLEIQDEDVLAAIYFIARLPEDRKEAIKTTISPKRQCQLCYMRGVHFTSECIFVFTQEQRKRRFKANRACSQCTLKYECKWHDMHPHDSLRCNKCEKMTDHVTMICPSDEQWEQNNVVIYKVRAIIAATRDWKRNIWIDLLHHLKSFADEEKSSPNAWRYRNMKLPILGHRNPAMKNVFM